jgi:hypothetical protein
VLLILLRILLLLALIYYFIKLLGRWLSPGARVDRRGKEAPGSEQVRYRDLTDQTIEDADFEEIQEDRKQ